MASPIRVNPVDVPRELAPPTPAELQREYVSGGQGSWGARQVQALPWTLDDEVSREFGDDVWDRMLNDSQVSACLSILKASILEDGVLLAPAVDDEDEPDYKLAAEIRDEAEAQFEDLDTPLTDVLWDQLNGIAYGHSIAEEIYELRPGLSGRVMLQLKALKVKPRKTTAFVVDTFLNVLGILAAKPGQRSVSSWLGSNLKEADRQNVLPRQKFAILTWRPKEADPRGTSLLRPAFEPWWRKRQVAIEFLKFLAQFAGPSMWGTVSPDAPAILPPVLNADGSIKEQARTPEEALAVAMQGLQNGSFAALPAGTILNLIQSTGEGRAFLASLAQCNAEITKAILTQSLATEEGDHQARAAAEVHENVLGTLVRQGKQTVVRMIRRDVLKPWVEYNWGPKAAHLVPIPTLGSTEQQDRTRMWAAAASLYKAGYLSDDQLHAVDEALGLPARDMEAWSADKIALADAMAKAKADKAASQDDSAPDGDAPDESDDAEGDDDETVDMKRARSLRRLAGVTDGDLQLSVRYWKRHAPAALRALVDAEQDR